MPVANLPPPQFLWQALLPSVPSCRAPGISALPAFAAALQVPEAPLPGFLYSVWRMSLPCLFLVSNILYLRIQADKLTIGGA